MQISDDGEEFRREMRKAMDKAFMALITNVFIVRDVEEMMTNAYMGTQEDFNATLYDDASFIRELGTL